MKLTITSNPSVKKLYTKIVKTASQLEKMLRQMEKVRLQAKPSSSTTSSRRKSTTAKRSTSARRSKSKRSR